MDVEPKKGGGLTPKMDGENNGKPYESMDDLGGVTPIFGSTPQVDGRMVGWIVEVWCVSSMVFVAQHFWKERVMCTTWMSQEVSKWLVNWL